MLPVNLQLLCQSGSWQEMHDTLKLVNLRRVSKGIILQGVGRCRKRWGVVPSIGAQLLPLKEQTPVNTQGVAWGGACEHPSSTLLPLSCLPPVLTIVQNHVETREAERLLMQFTQVSLLEHRWGMWEGATRRNPHASLSILMREDMQTHN